jgi:hypothetical protein
MKACVIDEFEVRHRRCLTALSDPLPAEGSPAGWRTREEYLLQW